MRILGLALLLAATPSRQGGTPEQQLLKLIDRETQIANLLTAGKLAYDAGAFAAAVEKWEALLRIEGLPPDVENEIRPLVPKARSRIGEQFGAELGISQTSVPVTPVPVKDEPPPKPAAVNVSGTIGGGGAVGPGGAVITLRRVDNWTPKPTPITRRMLEKEKRFAPRVLAVPVGSSVTFRNEDEIFHNVFSLSPAATFDTGLHKGGAETVVKFEKPGVIELLCNIHATMMGYLVVVDTPYYAVSDGNGGFLIKGVPPGEYEATLWHENSNSAQKRKVTIAEGVQLAFTVSTDKRPNPFPPDKYGKPRQQQLGY